MFSDYRENDVIFGIYSLTKLGADTFASPSDEIVNDYRIEHRSSNIDDVKEYAKNLFLLTLQREWQGAADYSRKGFYSKYYDKYLEENGISRESVDEYGDNINIDRKTKNMIYKDAARLMLSKYFLKEDVDKIVPHLLAFTMGGQLTLPNAVEKWLINNR